MQLAMAGWALEGRIGRLGARPWGSAVRAQIGMRARRVYIMCACVGVTEGQARG